MKGSGKKDLLNMKGSVNLGDFLPVTTTSTTTSVPYSSCSNLLGLGSDNINDQQPLMGSSRWNPTAEQLLALEEMYRRGTRTPSADQIQQIALQLRRFGKIEGKNVFYWFQNHKARERQKRRREADSTPTIKLHAGFLNDNKPSGLKPVFELQQKNTFLEGPFPMHIGGGGTEESTITEKNYTWHDLNNTKTTTSSCSRSRLINFENQIQINEAAMSVNKKEEENEIETLELFPVCKSGEEEMNGRRRKLNDRKVPTRTINTNQYFEFLN